MNVYFQSDCTFDDNSTQKSVKRSSIIYSSFYSDVENNVNIFHKPYAQFDIDITAIRKTKILGICQDKNTVMEECLEIPNFSVLTYSGDVGGWWNVIVAQITEDENTGKEKIRKELWLAPGANMKEANKNVINTFYVDCVFDYHLVDTKLTKITEVLLVTELIKNQ